MDGKLKTVQQLQSEGILLVEDGNHGENRPRPEEFEPNGTAFVRAADLLDGRVNFDKCERINRAALGRIRKGIGKPNDIILSHKGTVGKLARVNESAPDFVCSPQTTFWRVTESKKLDRNYLYAFMRSPAFGEQLKAVQGETDMAPYVSLTAQRRLQIPVPSMIQQETIGLLFSALDDKIELNRAMAETLEATARALFKSWFVDFDPVNAKAEGSLSSPFEDIADLFPSRLDDGVPERWSSTNNELAVVERASVQPSQVPPETPYVGLEHIDTRNLFLTRNGYAPDVDSMKTRFKKGDLLFGKLRPYFHKVVMAPFDGICSSDILVFRPRQGVPLSFLALAFSEKSFVDMATNASGGTRMPRADWGYMRAQTTVRPPDELLSVFHSAAGPWLKRAQAAQDQSRTLAALRDTLLLKLVAGEMHIRDAERALAVA